VTARSKVARLLRSCVRIPSGALISVWSVMSVVCCQVEVELIIRPEESYRLWCDVVCDLENLVNEEVLAD
jgi:hypothetical protein